MPSPACSEVERGVGDVDRAVVGRDLALVGSGLGRVEDDVQLVGAGVTAVVLYSSSLPAQPCGMPVVLVADDVVGAFLEEGETSAKPGIVEGSIFATSPSR